MLAIVAFPEDEVVRHFFQRLGPVAPLAYVIGEIIQILIIPIPGQPFEVAGGWLFGLVNGTVLGAIGAVVGSMAAFGLARRYGKPWVEARVSTKVRRKVLDRFATGERAEWIVFWLMMIPAFPRDPLCYLAGLTTLSARQFLLIAVLGRTVGLAPWVALGSDGVEGGVRVQIYMAAVAVAIWVGQRLIVRWTRRTKETAGVSETAKPDRQAGRPHA